MFSLILLSVFVALAAGLVWKFSLDHIKSLFEITWLEFAVTSTIISLLVVPIVVLVGSNIAKNNLLEFSEFWSGYETEAEWTRIKCEKDGQCRHTYDCDPYWVPVTRTRSVPDGSGGTRTETYTEMERRYHSCPYTNEEWTFTVSTSIGDTFTIARHNLQSNPEQNRWRGDGFEDWHPFLANKPSGIPPRWQAVKDRLDANTPGAVTAVKPYDNYILASQYSILKTHSDAIAEYQEANLLPQPVREVYDHYLADKVYVLGDLAIDEEPWQDAVMRFNAALGTTRQGDLHVVFVANDEPDRYTQALKAYWSSPELGDYALSKNGLVLVIGTDGSTVQWARAFTGMPTGNEQLISSVRAELTDAPLDPAILLGIPVGRLQSGEVAVEHSEGLFEAIVFAENGGFERTCMLCEDEEDEGIGFSYLGSEIEPSIGQKAVIGIVAFLLTLAAWAVPVLIIGQRKEIPFR